MIMSGLLSVLACMMAGASWASAQQAEPAPADLPAPATRQIDFAHDIKPLFEATCVQCHAKGKTKGGLSLETRESFLKGGDTGPAALPACRRPRSRQQNAQKG
jgi:mono/diheme cytochrome c family protein